MKHVQLLQQHTFTESKIQSRHFTIFSYSSNMIKISGAYNQLTRILTWRGRRKTNETLPAETDGTADQPHDPQQPPKRKKSSLRRLTKIIHKRKTKDSVSKERLVTGVDHGNSEEKMPTADTQKVTVVAYQTNLQTTEDVDEGACAKSANDAAQFEQLNMGLAFASSQDDLDEDSLLNSSGNSFFLDVAFRQPLNASIEVLEEVHILLKDIAKVNRDSQVCPCTSSYSIDAIIMLILRKELVKRDYTGNLQLNAEATRIPCGNWLNKNGLNYSCITTNKK